MADRPPAPGSNGPSAGNTGVGPDRGATDRAPRWVKVFGIIALVLVLLMFIAMLTGHGPGRHMPHGGRPADHTPPAGQRR